MRISVCVPMYNESSVIADNVKKVHQYLSEHFGDDFELVVADDGSVDGSADIVTSLGLENTLVVGYPKNMGKGCAVRTAVLASVGDVVVFTDADLAYGLDVIEEAVSRLESGEHQMVIASRAKHPKGYEGYTFIRRLASRTYISILALVTGIRVSDAQCGFKAFSGEEGRQIFSRCVTNNFAFDLEVILVAQKMKLKIYELPAMIINHRESKVSVLRDAPRMLREAVKIKKRVKNLHI